MIYNPIQYFYNDIVFLCVGTHFNCRSGGNNNVYYKYSIEEAKERCKRSIEFQKEHYAYFIALKSTDEAIGLCAIEEDEPHVFEECGICIGTAFHGKG